MIKINKQPNPILVDLFYNDEFIATLTYWESLDVREQISEFGYTGYSLFINKEFRHLYEIEEDIENFKVNINGGDVDKWFPSYYHSEKYGYVDTFGEFVVITRRIYNNQFNDIKNNKNEQRRID